VGKLGRFRGVSGEIYVVPATDFPERFLDLEAVYVGDRDRWQRMEIEAAKIVSDRPVVKFKGINSKEAVAHLTNRPLAVTKDQLVKLPQDVHYVFDLVGCRVHEYRTDALLGEITDVLQYPANDVYVIRVGDGSEVLFPAVTHFVKEIDTGNKKVVIDSAGLFKDAENQSGQ
jgi:16S rRNA processing protein RimM